MSYTTDRPRNYALLSREANYSQPVDLPEPIDLPFISWSKATHIRADVIRETIRDDGKGSVAYSVKVSGPVLTSKGVPHATNRGDQDFGEVSYGRSKPLTELPEPLARLLVGIAVLKDWSFTADMVTAR